MVVSFSICCAQIFWVTQAFILDSTISSNLCEIWPEVLNSQGNIFLNQSEIEWLSLFLPLLEVIFFPNSLFT